MAAHNYSSKLGRITSMASGQHPDDHSPPHEDFGSPYFTRGGANMNWENAGIAPPGMGYPISQVYHDPSLEGTPAAGPAGQAGPSSAFEFDPAQFDHEFSPSMGHFQGYTDDPRAGYENVHQPAAFNAAYPASNDSGEQGQMSLSPLEDKARILDEMDRVAGDLAGRWSQALSYKHRITVRPFMDHATDPTYRDVMKDREHWVEEIGNAIVNVDGVCDHPESRERKRFVNGAYDATQIPFTARTIFIAFVDQVIHGYRGSRDTSLKPFAAQQDDRNGNCLTRIQNIVTALKNDKRVCKDVLDDDSRIGDLVYAPLMVAKKKVSHADNNTRRIKQKEAKDQKLQELEARLEQGVGAGLNDDENSETHESTLTAASSPEAVQAKATPKTRPTHAAAPPNTAAHLPAKRPRGRPRKDAASPSTTALATPAPQAGRRNKRMASAHDTPDTLSKRSKKAVLASEATPQTSLPDMNGYTDLNTWANASLAQAKNDASGAAKVGDEADE